MTMRLHVEPDGVSPGSTDQTHTLLAVGRVMKSVTPTMVVGPDGRYLETRDLDRLVPEVLGAAGFPEPPPGLDAVFARFLSDVAEEDWNTWISAARSV